MLRACDFLCVCLQPLGKIDHQCWEFIALEHYVHSGAYHDQASIVDWRVSRSHQEECSCFSHSEHFSFPFKRTRIGRCFVLCAAHSVSTCRWGKGQSQAMNLNCGFREGTPCAEYIQWYALVYFLFKVSKVYDFFCFSSICLFAPLKYIWHTRHSLRDCTTLQCNNNAARQQLN